jgi:hypothetical protein
MALVRAQIHTNMPYICSKIDFPNDPQELQELCQEVQLHDDDNSILFTCGAYYKLLSNAIHEVRVSPTPRQTGGLVQSSSDKEYDKELLCYIWKMIAGPIHHYHNNPSLLYWFPKLDGFYTTASNFTRNNEPGQPTDDQTAQIPWGPEHCHQALHYREGHAFPSTR